MKKKILTLALCFMILFNIKVFASDGPEVEAIVTGTVDKGQTIQILINIKDIKSFFAGAMEFKYDKNILKVTKIEVGDLISKPEVNKFDAMNKIDDKNGIASYGFSCLGKVNGFSGTGTFVKISAEVLKKDSFHIRSKALLSQPNDDFNLKLQICDSDIKELEYNFKPYEFNINGTNNNTNTSSGSTTEKTSNENSSGTNNSNGTKESQNNANSGAKVEEKNTASESKNNKSFVQKVISAVVNVFNGNKKENTKKSEDKNKKDESNNKAQDVKDNSADAKKEGGASNSKNEAVAANGESKKKSNIAITVLAIVVVIGAAFGGYKIYKVKKRGKSENL